eukprot:gene268-8310_t
MALAVHRAAAAAVGDPQRQILGMRGMLSRWSQGPGCGTLSGEDGREYYLTTRPLRDAGLATQQHVGVGQGYVLRDARGAPMPDGRGGVRRADHVTVVEPALRERRLWGWDARESGHDGPNRLP